MRPSRPRTAWPSTAWPGPRSGRALLSDVAANKVDTAPYVYVLVNKVQPENLTLYNNGAVQFANILVNTGAPGADTPTAPTPSSST